MRHAATVEGPAPEHCSAILGVWQAWLSSCVSQPSWAGTGAAWYTSMNTVTGVSQRTKPSALLRVALAGRPGRSEARSLCAGAESLSQANGTGLALHSSLLLSTSFSFS
jgi:hypothetical protein